MDKGLLHVLKTEKGGYICMLLKQQPFTVRS
jgi:hypothetical protein